MKTRREMCVFILWLMLAPLVAWLGNTTVHAASASQSRNAGEWQGAIARLHLILKIDQAADGALDPATPPEASAQAARDLINSRVVVVKEGTHGTGSPCIDGLISQFVEQSSPGTLDASCVDQIHLPPFLTQAQIDRRNGNNAAR